MTHTLHLGDCRTVLATLDDNSIDAIVCDPPYELGFMGKAWDNSGIAYNVTVWQQCLRVLKPGGHLVAFGGSRTYHRLAVAIEDAGFEIRDQIQWIYGSGFPKSLDVSKAMDKQAGAVREVVTDKREDMFGEYEVDKRYKAATQTGVMSGFNGSEANELGHTYATITAPATDLAKQWQGWGTALKPAHEPAVLARKPLCGTVADNVTAWGVGALNIDGARVEAFDGYEKAWDTPVRTNIGNGSATFGTGNSSISGTHLVDISANKPTAGRWPANVIFDEEAAQVLDGQSGHSVSSATPRHNGEYKSFSKGKDTAHTTHGHSDSGGASRFFYTVPSEYNCCLCYNTCAKDMTTEEICKHILVSNAANHGWITQETNEFTAHVTALLTQNAQLARNAKSAIPQCALCATSIAVALAEIRTSGFNHQRCERILGYMPRFANSILIRSLASFAELWGNTDIIPTTQNLLMLYGYVLHAIENYIKQESKARVAGDSDQAQATRFLYNAKASKAEREAGLDAPIGERANFHPTVKPLSLMRYLVRLVTPKGGKVLDPFMGSGSTGCAAVLEGCDFVGIDITPEYVAIAQKRIAHYAVESPLEGIL